jgi:broad specificity phosphatase PhoE
MTESTTPPPRETLLLLVRHGETPTTGVVLPGRAPGLHLSDRGRAQAERFALGLVGLLSMLYYSSPLARARETAAAAALGTGLPVTTLNGITECDFGEWTGARLADLALLPQWQTVQRSPSTFRFPGGDGFVDMQARMVEALQGVCAAHPGGVIVCYSHADPIKAAISHALGAGLDHFQRIAISPGAVSVISQLPGRAPAVLMVNSSQEPLRGLRAS